MTAKVVDKTWTNSLRATSGGREEQRRESERLGLLAKTRECESESESRELEGERNLKSAWIDWNVSLGVIGKSSRVFAYVDL
jgi:hypothetical protein